MAMKISMEEFLGSGEQAIFSADYIVEKMALDIETAIFLRLKELGLKQKDLAHLLGISPAAVSKMLSNTSNMKLVTLAKIAAALNCSISVIQFEPVSDSQNNELESKTEQIICPISA